MTRKNVLRAMISRARYYVAEHENDGVTFGLPLTYTYNLHVHQRTKLSPFSIAITRLALGSNAIPRRMPPAVSEIDSPLAYRLHLIRRADLVRNIANSNTKKAQARYEEDNYKHI